MLKNKYMETKSVIQKLNHLQVKTKMVS